MPERNVRIAVTRQQGGIPDDHALIRDHNSEHDPVMPTDGVMDLADGNAFYSVPKCEAENPRPDCKAPAKMVYVVNDHWEIVTRPAQTGRTLRDLFALNADVELLRDRESPDDEVVGDGDDASFGNGCVFGTRKAQHVLFIYVNKRKFTERDGVKKQMTGREIAALDSDQPDKTRVERLTEDGKIEIGLDQTVAIECGDAFQVIRCNINAGFQNDRVQRELALLSEGGLRVTLIEGPMPAVIYHDVPVRAGLPLSATDVLVKIPSGYPGGILDNAFLPAGSSLLDCTPGAKQQTETIGRGQWTQKSIHPHANCGTAWNKDRHGIHTYYSEIQNWLHAAQ